MTIEIDGGWGEGGGQMVRTAVGLASALGERAIIRDIRKGRKQPGLRAQHLSGIKLAAEMCDADVSGLEIGSTEIDFSPRSNTGGEFNLDIGTAGSISLVLQTCLIPAIMAKGPTRFFIRGGTDVPWSPPMDYLRMVMVPIIQQMGGEIEISVRQRGFYPSGGGELIVEVSPAGQLKSMKRSERGKLIWIEGSIACRNLPEHVVERAKNAAIKGLADQISPKILVDHAKGPSTGVSLVLAAHYENAILGSSALGEKGMPAEKLGEIAARGLRDEIDSGATLDMHAADQMIPFLFLAKDSSRFLTSELTLHAKTNIWVAQQFIKREAVIEDEDKVSSVTIK